MDQTLVSRWEKNKEQVRIAFMKRPDSYEDIVRAVVKAVSSDEYEEAALDPERIHLIDDGDYQGTLVFVIAEQGYQPSSYWYVKVNYGSCSGCDTFQSIQELGEYDEPPTSAELDGYMTLALHIVQGLKKMGDEEVA